MDDRPQGNGTLKTMVVALLPGRFPTGCPCGKKYPHLQAQVMEESALRQRMEEDHARQVQERDRKISELLPHLRELNLQIRELDPQEH